MNTIFHFVSLTLLVIASGCTLETVDSHIDVDFDALAEGVESHNTVSVNPNENPDVVANRDYIKGIDVSNIVFTVRSIGETNRAQSGSGEVYVRAAGADWDAEPIATFEETPVEVGVTKTLAVTPEQIARIEALMTDAFEARIDGHVDQGPLSFGGRLTFDVQIRAGL